MDKKYQMKSLADADVQKQLKNASPLDMVQTLQNIELHNQQSSTKVIDDIYKEFEGGGSTVEPLLKPLVISLVDSGLSRVKILQDKKGKKSVSVKKDAAGTAVNDYLSGAVIWEAINDFSYEKYDTQQNTETALADRSNDYRTENRRGEMPGKFDRKEYEHSGNKAATRQARDKVFGSGERVYVNSDIEGKRAYHQSKQDSMGRGSGHKQKVEADHVVSLKALHVEYGKNIFVDKDMVKAAGDNEHNIALITQGLNNAKSEHDLATVRKMRAAAQEKKARGEKLSSNEQSLVDTSDEAMDRFEAREEMAKADIEAHIRKQALDDMSGTVGRAAANMKNEALKAGAKEAMRMGVAEFIKITIFEIKDMILNGFKGGVGARSLMAALKARIRRITRYLKQRVWPAIKELADNVMQTLVKEFFKSLPLFFTNIFKKFMQLVADGMHAIIQAFKILKKPSSEMTSAQKGDALVKVFISIVTPFLTTFLLQLPLGPFEELAEAILGGVVSCILVWAVDKADIFNTKADRRSQRVKEVFEYRVRQIKQNVDVFDRNATEAFIQQRAAFDGMRKQISDAIDANKPLHELSTNLADFMGVGEKIKIRDTDSFAELLASNRQLTI